MPKIVVCSQCLQGYSDVTLRYCVHDGTVLSLPVDVDWNEGDEVETVLRSAPSSWPSLLEDRSSDDSKPKRKKTNPKAFLTKHFPDLLQFKRRTSRPWLNSEKPEYNDNWWFNFLVEELENTDHILFVGALDREDKDFKVFKIPTDFLKANLGHMDKTNDGWVNLYIHIESYKDLRNPAGLSFRDFLVN